MNNKMIPYGRQEITDEDINAVISTLKSDYLTQGPKINEFEIAFANYIGSKYAVAVSNGTAALHLCALSIGIKKGDKVITSPITFSASANCIRYCGAQVVFVDIDPKTYLLDLDKVEQILEKSNGDIKGVIPVDFAGRSCDYERLKHIAKKFNLWIIEDSCHSPGGYFFDKKNIKQNCGNGIFSDLSIFSFHPVKHIATGEGGMITTNSKKLYNKLKNLRTHGITKNKEFFENSNTLAGGKNTYPDWYMEMQDLGYNYRLTDIQASLGLSQLKRASCNIEIRKKIAKKYYNVFKQKKYILGQSGYIDGHAYHLYIIEIENRLELYNFLKKNNIFCQIHYFPCHLMPYYRNLGWNIGDLPNAEEYYKRCITLPIFPTLNEKEQDFIIEKILSFYET